MSVSLIHYAFIRKEFNLVGIIIEKKKGYTTDRQELMVDGVLIMFISVKDVIDKIV